MKIKKKRSAGEILEEIETLGQEDENKAIKWVKEVGKRDEQESKEEFDDSLTKLESKKKRLGYKDALVEEIQGLMRGLSSEVPKGFGWNCVKSDKGIVFIVFTPDGKRFVRGNTVCLIPEIDMQGALEKLYDMIDFMESLLPKEEDSLVDLQGNKLTNGTTK